jgi:sterol desaturase/sphingolipid hydroxylase (fatty acid hydroxylase superfamily)
MGQLKEAFTRLQFEDLVNYGFWDLFSNVVVFVALALPAFLIFWIIYKEKFKPRRIQVLQGNLSRVLRHEIRHSVISLLIFTFIDMMIYLAQMKGYTKIYTEVSEYGWWYLGSSVALMIFLHDTLYYFLHRFMHHPRLYKYVHRVHHLSTDPSPFAAFSFHPLEAIVESFPYIVFAFLFPVHLVALWTWQLIQISMNVVAHLGYEIYPEGFNTHWLFKFKTPSTHHNMHHAKVGGNYGLYFTWWDKLLKTEFKDYDTTYNQIQEKIKESKAPAITAFTSNPVHSDYPARETPEFT